MLLETHQYDECLLIKVNSERIDAASAVQFKDRMRELAGGGSARLVLDMKMVGFVDSSGLGAIIASMKQLAQGQMIELAALSGPVDKLFRLTKMDAVFTLHQTVEAALGASRKTG